MEESSTRREYGLLRTLKSDGGEGKFGHRKGASGPAFPKGERKKRTAAVTAGRKSEAVASADTWKKRSNWFRKREKRGVVGPNGGRKQHWLRMKGKKTLLLLGATEKKTKMP